MIALLRRDLALAVRAGGGFGLGLAFFLIVVVLVPFGVGPDRGTLTLIAPGILWVAALLAALLSLDRIFALDFEDGSLALLATAPLPLEGIALIKALAHWMTTGLPLTLVAPALGFFLNMAPDAYGYLLVSLALGTPALSMIGSFAAITAGVAALCAHANFRGRGGAPRRRWHRGDSAADADGCDHAGMLCAAALRICGGIAHQPAVIRD